MKAPVSVTIPNPSSICRLFLLPPKRPDWLDQEGRLPLLFAVNSCRLRRGLFTMNLHFAADTLECEFLISCPFIYICCLVI